MSKGHNGFLCRFGWKTVNPRKRARAPINVFFVAAMILLSTNHSTGWDNLKIISSNPRYIQRLCLETWHINAAHNSFQPRDDRNLPDADFHLIRGKGH